MISTENNMIKVLIDITKDIQTRCRRQEKLMEECIQSKLNNTLDLYENDMEDTCRYIMIRNPIIMTKNISKVTEETNDGKCNK